MKASGMQMTGNITTSAVLAVLIGLLVLGTLSGRKMAWLSNERVVLIAVVVLGMAMCTRGIGRVAALGAWGHPLAILGYLVGALILLIAAVGLSGKPLLWISTPRDAVVTAALLTALKLALSTLHRFL